MADMLLPLSSVPADDVEKLLDDAFGAERHKRTAYLLRQGMTMVEHLSFAVVEGDGLCGTIQCWPISVGNTPLLLVGPVAVSTAKQNQGFGQKMMRAMLAAVEPDDAPMVMIGDPEYYGRFGFDAEQTGGWTLPGPWEPRRLLLRNPHGLTLPQSGLLGPRTSL